VAHHFVLHALALTLTMTALLSDARAADPVKEILLWPAGHPGNAGGEPTVAGSPEWLELDKENPSITPFLPEPDKRTGSAVVICPGGGYGNHAMGHEGQAIAEWLRERGVAGIVLRYRCGGGKSGQPAPLEDVQRAIRTVRSRASEWGIDPERVGVLGSSAGGHLASTAATMFDDDNQDGGQANAADPIARLSSRPSFAVLLYPVISMDKSVTHGGSRENLLGKNPPDEMVAQWSTDRRVTHRTPPTLIIATSDDKAVPVKNSLLFYEALLAHNVPAEMHIWETGGHGFGLRGGDRPVDQWAEQLEPWLRVHGHVK
jgi:acetyl esterase/lipase